MNRWDKVALKWGCFSGIGTSVRMDGAFDPSLNAPNVSYSPEGERLHGLFGIVAVSLFSKGEEDRRGEMRIDIRCLRRNLPPHSQALIGFLDAEFQRKTQAERHAFRYQPHMKGPERVSWTDTIFTVNFRLGNGEQFCDFTIELARAVFAALGIRDDDGIHLAHFSLTRETFIEMDKAWIPFPRWLRISHRLPIHGPEDSSL